DLLAGAGPKGRGRRAHRVPRRSSRGGGRLPRGGSRRGRQGQRQARSAPPLWPELLRGVRQRPRGQQHRGGLLRQVSAGQAPPGFGPVSLTLAPGFAALALTGIFRPSPSRRARSGALAPSPREAGRGLGRGAAVRPWAPSPAQPTAGRPLPLSGARRRRPPLLATVRA